MAYLGITASDDGLSAVGDGPDVVSRLVRALGDVPADAPIVIMIHGYRFHPGIAQVDPHRLLFSHRPDRTGWKIRSWPGGLGFDEHDGRSGLAIGFAWPAREKHLPSLLKRRCTGFAAVYDRAAFYGFRLAELVRMVQRLAHGRSIDVIAHSLGARVALCALRHLETVPERMILLGAAEFDARAREHVQARAGAGTPQIYNITARANDFYDVMFETFAPRRRWSDRAVGLGPVRDLPQWLDIQIDRQDVTAWINAQGVRLRPSEVRFCHWSFYTRAGAFDLYQAILRRRPGWDIASLRAAPCFVRQEPRWSGFRSGRVDVTGKAPPGPDDLTDLNRA